MRSISLLMAILLRLLQFQKAWAPIDLTVPGISTSVRFWQFLKALLPIAVTVQVSPSWLTVEGMVTAP